MGTPKGFFWLLVLCIPLNTHLIAQDVQDILPDQRQTVWKMAGLTGNTNTNQTLNILDFGAIPNGNVDISPIMSTVFDALGQEGGVILFPEGIYLFRNPLVLPSNVVIRGEGADKTVLKFNLFEPDNSISARGSIDLEVYSEVLESLPKGENKFMVADASLFEVGDFVLLQDTDDDLVVSPWAVGTTGQINQITAIDGNTIRLRSPVRRPFQLSRNPLLFPLEMVQNIGIEDLKVIREDATTEKNSNILFEWAYNCWIECIESEDCNYAHVEIGRSTNLKVSGNYFHHAHEYGGGGKGYGVMLHYNAGECLVENNVFKRLRHSMILQAGANGNVLAYNYSTDPYWTDVGLPPDAAGDLVLHGNYPYSNLLEGNIVQNIVIDDSHGTQGPYNTFFRNRAERYGIFMSLLEPTDKQNFIGNEVNGTLGLFIMAGEGHFSYGNNIKGQVMPDQTMILDDTTYYSSAPADFYLPGLENPPIGIPNELNSYSIAAKERYLLDMPIFCGSELPPSNTTNVLPLDQKAPELRISPNPTQGRIKVDLPGYRSEVVEVNIFDLQGQLLRHWEDMSLPLLVTSLPPGMLFVHAQLADGTRAVQKVWVR